MEWTTIMAVIKLNAIVVQARKEIRDRLGELLPLVAEYEILSAQLEIIEAANKKIAKLEAALERAQRPAATKANVDEWARKLDPDEIVSAADLSEHFGKYATWGRNHLTRLTDAKVLEKWGRGRWRKVPIRTGEAKLHVVSAGRRAQKGEAVA